MHSNITSEVYSVVVSMSVVQPYLSLMSTQTPALTITLTSPRYATSVKCLLSVKSISCGLSGFVTTAKFCCVI